MAGPSQSATSRDAATWYRVSPTRERARRGLSTQALADCERCSATSTVSHSTGSDAPSSMADYMDAEAQRAGIPATALKPPSSALPETVPGVLLPECDRRT